MDWILFGLFAVFLIFILGKSTFWYIEFERFCYLIAELENSMSQLHSSEGLDGNSSNPFRRKQLYRILMNNFVNYGNTEVVSRALKLKNGVIIVCIGLALFVMVIMVLLLLAP